MFKYFWLFFFIFAVGGLAYFGYPIVKNRYFDGKEKAVEVQPPAGIDQSVPGNETGSKTQTGDGTDGIGSPENSGSRPSENASDASSLLKITPSDCDAECSAFAREEKKMEYCRQVCGLDPAKEPSSGCETSDGLKKDYCLKDLAISRKDFKICGQIQDSNIKKTCQNRITEEILTLPEQSGGGY